ncbi:hypothetical protein [Adhaeretor mobilis]|uniref:hypothetical protein n=1 Tax=Adhaeretor mobilis TaxID=1930276 RepID=UPI0011A939A6|nr:hypothetical protein [Adhaeretor mobilis]
MLTFFFIVSVLNLALGYGLALYLGNPIAARSTAVALPTADQEVSQSEEEIHAILNQHDDEATHQEEFVEEKQPSGIEEPVKQTVEAVPAVAEASVADEVAQLETTQPEPAAEFASDPDAIKAALASADAGVAANEGQVAAPVASEEPAESETEQPAPVDEVAEKTADSTVVVEEAAEESPGVETEVFAGIEAFQEQLAASTESVPEEAAAPTTVDATSEAASVEEPPEVENVDADVMAGIQAFREQLAAMRVG